MNVGRNESTGRPLPARTLKVVNARLRRCQALLVVRSAQYGRARLRSVRTHEVHAKKPTASAPSRPPATAVIDDIDRDIPAANPVLDNPCARYPMQLGRVIERPGSQQLRAAWHETVASRPRKKLPFADERVMLTSRSMRTEFSQRGALRRARNLALCRRCFICRDAPVWPHQMHRRDSSTAPFQPR
jgi:hypothetical protein